MQGYQKAVIRRHIARLATLLLLGITGASCTYPTEPLGDVSPDGNDRLVWLEERYTFDIALGEDEAAKPDIPSSWIEFRAGDVFTFMGPSDLVDQQVQGIDSFTGTYLNETMRVSFDYWEFAAPAECGSTGQECRTEEIEVDGKQATLLRGRFRDDQGEDHFVAMIYVPEAGIEQVPVLGSEVKLSLSILATSLQKQRQEELELIVQSVDFVE